MSNYTGLSHILSAMFTGKLCFQYHLQNKKLKLWIISLYFSRQSIEVDDIIIDLWIKYTPPNTMHTKDKQKVSYVVHVPRTATSYWMIGPKGNFNLKKKEKKSSYHEVA